MAWAADAAGRGAGEVLLTSMDRDGTKDGYDLELTRAVSDAGGRVRLVLNVPPLEGGAQAPLQHVAFACADIVATARALRARGAPLLRVSDNYYDDLAARSELDPAVIEELRDRGGFDLPEGTVYPALHRLEAGGLVASRWSSESGRRRRVYSLTRTGRRDLARRRDEWRVFSGAVGAVIA